jgi:hypothetical protein
MGGFNASRVVVLRVSASQEIQSSDDGRFGENLQVSGTAQVAGSLTVGDGGAEDSKLLFDGNAQDYRIGIDDGTDILEIGAGTAHGSTTAIKINSSGQITQLGHQTSPTNGHFLKYDGSKIIFDSVSAGGGADVGLANTFTEAQTVAKDQDSELVGLILKNASDSNDTNGIISMRFDLEDTGGNAVDSAKIAVKKEQAFTATASTQDSSMVFSTSLNGTLTEQATLDSAGKLTVKALDAGDGDITNVGTIEADVIQSDADATGLNINFDGNTTKNEITLKDNLADALSITESGFGDYMTFTTTNSSEQVSFGVDNTGVDVRVFSETTNEGLLYDASADELGLLLTTKLSFHDVGGGENIHASANGHLEINAGTTLDMTAPTVDINAATAVTIDGPSVVIENNATNTPVVEIKNTHNGGTAGILKFNNTEAGNDGADGDDLGTIQFFGNDDGTPSAQQYAGVLAEIHDATSGEESGKLTLQVASHDGGVEDGLILTGGSADAEVDVTVGKGTASVTTIAGTLDLGDRNITNVGDIDADSVSVADAANGLNIDFSGANTGTGLITVADNLAAALTVKEGSNEIVKVVSTNSSEEIVLGYKLDLGDNDIENVGTISADKIQVDAAGTGLEIDFNGNTELNKIQLTDNLADALNIAEGSNSYMKFVTTNSSELVQFSKDVEFGGDTATFTSANANDPLVVIKNTANDADGARLQFVKDKGAAGADGDDIGIIEFVGDDAAQAQTTFAKIVAEVSEADNTDEAGKLSFFVAESDGTDTALTAGLVLEGEHATDGEVDVTIAAGAASTTTVAGSLTVTSGIDANDANITNVGVIEADTIQSDADGTGLTVNFDGNTTKNEITLKDNLADALSITESGFGDYMTFITTNSSEQVSFGVNDTGVDVRVFSATNNEGLLYDASEDELALLLTTKLKFHDVGGGEEIFASANGHLEVNAGTTLDMTAPTVDVNASTAVTITSPSVVIDSGTSEKPLVEIKNTNDDGNGSTLKFTKDGTSVADGDVIGNIEFVSEDDGDNAHTFAKIIAKVDDMTGGQEEGSLEFHVAENDGTLTKGMDIVGLGSDGNVTVDISTHDGSAGGLKLGGTLVTSTAAELNLLDAGNGAMADGLWQGVERLAVATIDSNDYSIATHNLGITIPDNAIITDFIVDITTAFQSAGTSEITLFIAQSGTPVTLISARPFNNGGGGAFFHALGPKNGTTYNFFGGKTDGAGALSLTVGDAALQTAGEAKVYVKYIIGS